MIRKAMRLILLLAVTFPATTFAAPWTADKANAWYKGRPVPVGCNFNPSTAINQLEMWQGPTFDPGTIDRELKWAESLGFNSVRVFLHDIAWRQDREKFLDRMEEFLDTADEHGISVMFVLFDSVWDPFPKAGPQPAPKPHVHNSGWVQSPGLETLKDPARQAELEGYVKGVISRFWNDKRVIAWDLYNEPDNTNGSSYGAHELPNKVDLTLTLLKKVFVWARESNPTQPLTSGIWIGDWDEAKLSPTARFQLAESDVISFHTYGPLAEVKARVGLLKKYDRPLLCTEYMARPLGSTFDPVLGWFVDERIGAYNWGFVAGKSQTIYPWDSWKKPYRAEPDVWFHDIFRADGTAYDKKEVEYIKGVTAKIPRSKRSDR